MRLRDSEYWIEHGVGDLVTKRAVHIGRMFLVGNSAALGDPALGDYDYT